MIIFISKKRIVVISIFITLILCVTFFIYQFNRESKKVFENEELAIQINNIFNVRSRAILDHDEERLATLYDRDVKYGIWAYEHELKRMKYLHLWSQKQGIKFISIKSRPVIRYSKERSSGYRINLMVTTEYRYFYEDEPDIVNNFRIGTYHSVDIVEKDEGWVITREWYTDPFADSLNVEKTNTEEIKKYILSMKPRDFSDINERRKKAVEYADKYVGAAGSDEYGYSYNKEYIDYNSRGGDCANFASQILHEGGNFRKNYTWNYSKGGSRAWVNAQAFKDYMIYSGRASKIAYGTYKQVYKASYKLLPGDFIAYEKKGKVTHISVVTGVDSKGYTLVNCHNTDRYRVPWDLGWSNRGIRFWLVRVHY